MKEKIGFQEKVSFVLNGQPVVTNVPPPSQQQMDAEREKLEQEELLRRQKQRETND